VPAKHDFDHTFDVPPFAGKTTAYVLTEPRGGRNKKGTIQYDKRTKEPLTKVVTRTCAVVNTAFINSFQAIRVFGGTRLYFH
jgi:hypothetical protein